MRGSHNYDLRIDVRIFCVYFKPYSWRKRGGGGGSEFFGVFQCFLELSCSLRGNRSFSGFAASLLFSHLVEGASGRRHSDRCRERERDKERNHSAEVRCFSALEGRKAAECGGKNQGIGLQRDYRALDFVNGRMGDGVPFFLFTLSTEHGTPRNRIGQQT